MLGSVRSSLTSGYTIKELVGNRSLEDYIAAGGQPTHELGDTVSLVCATCRCQTVLTVSALCQTPP